MDRSSMLNEPLGPGFTAMCSKKVEAYSGYTYGERPVALYWEGERLKVANIKERWRTPGGKGFHVEVEDGRTFELLYIDLHDDWKIHLV
jgi:hypothetical protein